MDTISNVSIVVNKSLDRLENKMDTAHEILKARELFERHMAVKGLEAKWDGKKFATPNVQTKWRYFLLGFMAKGQA